MAPKINKLAPIQTWHQKLIKWHQKLIKWHQFNVLQYGDHDDQDYGYLDWGDHGDHGRSV